MYFLFAIGEGVRDILSHKFRSILTISGVVLGAASLIVMFAITEGMAVNMRARFQESGDMEKVILQPKAPPREQREIAEISPGITYKDVLALRGASPNIAWISPGISQNIRAYHEGRQDWTTLRGVEQGFLDQDKHIQPIGRFISDLDIERKSRVCVLASKPVDRLFKNPDDAVGSTITMNGVNFKVVGRFPRYLSARQKRDLEAGLAEERQKRHKERTGRTNQKRTVWGYDPFPWKNDFIAIPLTTMQAVFKSANMQNGVDLGPQLQLDEIQIGVKDAQKLPDLIDQVNNVILVNHRGIEDFRVWNRLEKLAEIEEQIFAARVSGGIIAGIGLLVGGIGITNIMLASIVDRIRELGIRLAIGGTPFNIFTQVLVESILLSLVGGVVGALFGWGLVYTLDEVAQVPSPPVLKPYAVALSFSFAIVTGILAGLYPALKASMLRPVEALKFD